MALNSGDPGMSLYDAVISAFLQTLVAPSENESGVETQNLWGPFALEQSSQAEMWLKVFWVSKVKRAWRTLLLSP